MIGLDTNVLIRYLVQDDARQAAAATTLIESLSAAGRGFVSLVTLVETAWVLDRSYRLDRPAIEAIMARMLGAVELSIERPDVVGAALGLFADGADFSDAVIEASGREAGCEYTLTFDRRASGRTGMRLLSW